MRYVGVDPSTETGLVILDKHGEVIVEKEITSKHPRNLDPLRFIDIAEQALKHINRSDSIYIESFSYGSRGKGVSTQYGIGWILRSELIEYPYVDIPPSSLKKFASGRGNIAKDGLAVEIYKRWGYEHKSDNVRDAYVLAQMARYVGEGLDMTKFQREVIENLGKGD